MELIKLKGKRRKLKVVLLVSCLLILVSTRSKAQTFAEWFSQKKTQIKYLTQQIAALEQYRKDVEQGYRIEHSGWNGIDSWVKDELDLHSAYYNSLKTVNPVIKDDWQIDSIITYAQSIPLWFDHLNGLTTLDGGTHNYIDKVKAIVLNETDKDLSELQLIITDDRIQLADDERIKRLDNIYSRVKEKRVFTQSFCGAVRMLIIQRNSELNDINTLKGIYGIN